LPLPYPVGLTLRVKLCGQGLRAEACAARRLPRSMREDANRDLQPTCRRDSRELTSRLGRRASAGPHQLLRGVGRRCGIVACGQTDHKRVRDAIHTLSTETRPRLMANWVNPTFADVWLH
jgi:hypothetical protein